MTCMYTISVGNRHFVHRAGSELGNNRLGLKSGVNKQSKFPNDNQLYTENGQGVNFFSGRDFF